MFCLQYASLLSQKKPYISRYGITKLVQVFIDEHIRVSWFPPLCGIHLHFIVRQFGVFTMYTY